MVSFTFCYVVHIFESVVFTTCRTNTSPSINYNYRVCSLKKDVLRLEQRLTINFQPLDDEYCSQFGKVERLLYSLILWIMLPSISTLFPTGKRYVDVGFTIKTWLCLDLRDHVVDSQSKYNNFSRKSIRNIKLLFIQLFSSITINSSFPFKIYVIVFGYRICNKILFICLILIGNIFMMTSGIIVLSNYTVILLSNSLMK